MKKIYSIALIAAVLAGCNIGNAPEPMSDSDVKSAIDNMSPEQRIKFIEGSPMSKAEKEKEIAAIKAKHGIK